MTDTTLAKFNDISCQFPDSLLGASWNQKALVDEPGGNAQQIIKLPQYLGRFGRYHPATTTSN